MAVGSLECIEVLKSDEKRAIIRRHQHVEEGYGLCCRIQLTNNISYIFGVSEENIMHV